VGLLLHPNGAPARANAHRAASSALPGRRGVAFAAVLLAARRLALARRGGAHAQAGREDARIAHLCRRWAGWLVERATCLFAQLSLTTPCAALARGNNAGCGKLCCARATLASLRTLAPLRSTVGCGKTFDAHAVR